MILNRLPGAGRRAIDAGADCEQRLTVGGVGRRCHVADGIGHAGEIAQIVVSIGGRRRGRSGSRAYSGALQSKVRRARPTIIGELANDLVGARTRGIDAARAADRSGRQGDDVPLSDDRPRCALYLRLRRRIAVVDLGTRRASDGCGCLDIVGCTVGIVEIICDLAFGVGRRDWLVARRHVSAWSRRVTGGRRERGQARSALGREDHRGQVTPRIIGVARRIAAAAIEGAAADMAIRVVGERRGVAVFIRHREGLADVVIGGEGGGRRDCRRRDGAA